MGAGWTGRKGDEEKWLSEGSLPIWLTWLPDKWRLEELVEEVRLRDGLKRWKIPPPPRARCYNNPYAFVSAIFPPLSGPPVDLLLPPYESPLCTLPLR